MDNQNKLQRYKKNIDVENARAKRAVQRRMEQKLQRKKSYFRNRFITPSQQLRSFPGGNYTNQPQQQTSTSKKLSKIEKQQLAKQRYRDMLVWKEEKHKELEAEKRKRKAPFKAGLYEPDKPKFLSGIDPPSNEDPSICLCRSLQKSTQKLQNHNINSPKSLANRMLSFKPTPLSTSSAKTHRGASSRSVSQRKGLPKIVGVTPLPKTPCSTAAKKKPLSSFAPKNFSFRPPSNIKPFVFKSKTKSAASCQTSKANPITVFTRLRSRGHPKEWDNLLHSNASFGNECNIMPKSEPTANISSDTLPDIAIKEGIQSDRASNFNADKECAFENEEISMPTLNTTLENVDQIDIDKENLNYGLFSNLLLEQDHSSDVEVDSTDKENTDLIGNTHKAKKSVGRPKSSRKYIDTPLRTKLRPRTPCSRTTRRSHSAHCDRLSLGSVAGILTPLNSTKRKSRQSKVNPKNSNNEQNQNVETQNSLRASKVCFAEHDTEIPTENSPKDHSLSSKAIRGILSSCKKDYGSDNCTTPVIENKPHISKNSSPRKPQRRPMTNIEKMFNFLPFEGSSPQLEMNDEIPSDSGQLINNNDKENTPISLVSHDKKVNSMTPYLIPSDPVVTGSPSLDVWGDHKEEISLYDEDAPNTFTKEETGSCASKMKKDKIPKKKKKSARFSVTFAADEKDDGNVSTKYCNTPLRRSTRFKDDDDVSQVDLISWNTPTPIRGSKLKVSTPVRRSVRLAGLKITSLLD